MLSSPDLEIRTRSVPTAGHLLALGFEPLGIVMHPSGTKTFRFSPDAREALERFLLAKQKLDAMLADALEGSGARSRGSARSEQ
jgi:hypothetical protein